MEPDSFSKALEPPKKQVMGIRESTELHNISDHIGKYLDPRTLLEWRLTCKAANEGAAPAFYKAFYEQKITINSKIQAINEAMYRHLTPAAIDHIQRAMQSTTDHIPQKLRVQVDPIVDEDGYFHGPPMLKILYSKLVARGGRVTWSGLRNMPSLSHLAADMLRPGPVANYVIMKEPDTLDEYANSTLYICIPDPLPCPGCEAPRPPQQPARFLCPKCDTVNDNSADEGKTYYICSPDVSSYIPLRLPTGVLNLVEKIRKLSTHVSKYVEHISDIKNMAGRGGENFWFHQPLLDPSRSNKQEFCDKLNEVRHLAAGQDGGGGKMNKRKKSRKKSRKKLNRKSSKKKSRKSIRKSTKRKTKRRSTKRHH
jgi:hypothetical protein